MKKVIVMTLCIVFLAAIVSAAPIERLRSSGVKTSTALIYTGGTLFGGVLISTDGTNAVTLDVYDGISAAGTKIIPQQIIPSSATSRSFSLSIDPAVEVYTGIYVVVSVAGAGSCAYTVYFK